jgi:hypothetical protein
MKRLAKRSFCQRIGQDPTTLDAQLDFVSYELRTTFTALVQAANKETMIEAVKAAFGPYFDALRKGRTSNRKET